MPGRRGSCNPSYGGQWAFSWCECIGCDLIRIPIRELYKPTPGWEILHAHQHAVAPWRVEAVDHAEEHIASKTARLVEQLLDLADNLVQLGATVGVEANVDDVLKFSRGEIAANWWHRYPQLSRLIGRVMWDLRYEELKITDHLELSRYFENPREYEPKGGWRFSTFANMD
ncbi:hypothetical protein PAN31117_00610 [Pandoraea anapnoica]|uniref:Uncharacterized protein n=2 Tax=Pandoraea anapnoica TaxID=2508301 RepID=A0A5E4ZKP7_9BURK|nr:hypothetical protein PAN31117_00610 [Pandoraea anapnoica]